MDLCGVAQQRPHRPAALGQITEVCQLLPGRIRTVEIAATRGREAVGFGHLGQIFCMSLVCRPLMTSTASPPASAKSAINALRLVRVSGYLAGCAKTAMPSLA